MSFYRIKNSKNFWRYLHFHWNFCEGKNSIISITIQRNIQRNDIRFKFFLDLGWLSKMQIKDRIIYYQNYESCNWFDSLSKIKNDKTYRRANICLLLSSSTALSFDVGAISWMWIVWIDTFVASKVTCLPIINPIKIGELAIISCITSCGTLSFCRIYVISQITSKKRLQITKRAFFTNYPFTTSL